MTLRPTSSYAGEIRARLSAKAFAPARSRLVWVPVHSTIIALATVALARGWVSWPWSLLLSLVIGASFGGLTFAGHEILHGAVVRGRRLRHFFGGVCFLPFVISPGLWVAWHNRVHHGNTGRAGVDPDAYPTLAEYTTSRHVRIATDHFSLGRRHWGGALTLLLGFTIQSGQMLASAKKLALSGKELRSALGETALAFAFWSAVCALIGFVPFLFAYVIPLFIANAIVMAFIITNHSLSPLTEVNDPLVNSLSVTTPRWIEWVTLRFGFHVEHHLFPAMSSRGAVEVRDLIRSTWPERYQSMPIGRALWTIARTGRVYKDDKTLLDPRTGHEWPVLSPGEKHGLPESVRELQTPARGPGRALATRELS